MSIENLSFEEAYRELESIVKSLEDNVLTVDDLENKISRAAKLITHCRQKLTSTELEVQKILGELDAGMASKSISTDQES